MIKVYACPCCGQGGLEVVRIKLSDAIEAVVCSECDRIWLAPDKVGLHNDAMLETTLSNPGLSASWSNLECIAQGVPWERIDPACQAILSSKRHA